MITKNELIEYLQEIPGNPVMIMSKDSEGNSYSPLTLPLGFGWYVPENNRSGEITDEEPENTEKNPPCVVFYP